VARLQQPPGQPLPDEAAGPGDEDIHRATAPIEELEEAVVTLAGLLGLRVPDPEAPHEFNPEGPKR